MRTKRLQDVLLCFLNKSSVNIDFNEDGITEDKNENNIDQQGQNATWI